MKHALLSFTQARQIQTDEEGPTCRKHGNITRHDKLPSGHVRKEAINSLVIGQLQQTRLEKLNPLTIFVHNLFPITTQGESIPPPIMAPALLIFFTVATYLFLCLCV